MFHTGPLSFPFSHLNPAALHWCCWVSFNKTVQLTGFMVIPWSSWWSALLIFWVLLIFSVLLHAIHCNICPRRDTSRTSPRERGRKGESDRGRRRAAGRGWVPAADMWNSTHSSTPWKWIACSHIIPWCVILSHCSVKRSHCVPLVLPGP